MYKKKKKNSIKFGSHANKRGTVGYVNFMSRRTSPYYYAHITNLFQMHVRYLPIE